MKKAAPKRERHKVRMKQVYPRYSAVIRKVACLESLVRVVESQDRKLGIADHAIARARNSGRRRTPEMHSDKQDGYVLPCMGVSLSSGIWSVQSCPNTGSLYVSSGS